MLMVETEIHQLKSGSHELIGAKCLPCGRLAEILDEFGAPEDVRFRFASRFGDLIGNGQDNGRLITHEQLKGLIVNSLDAVTGLLDWGVAEERLEVPARRIRRGKTPFSRRLQAQLKSF